MLTTLSRGPQRTGSGEGDNEDQRVQKVKAIVRVRPFLSSEQPLSKSRILSLHNDNTIKIVHPRIGTSTVLSYKFDGCYGEDASQIKIFANDVVPIIDRVIEGYNATIFAYGNTGTGKTFTMEGSSANPGMIPLTIQYLLETLQKRYKTACLPSMDLEVSYLEIYKEKVYDLLSFNPAAMDLPIREDFNHKILIPDLTSQKIKCLSDFERIWAKGVNNRRTAATKLNAHSSRSHSCLSIRLPMKEAKLHLIDLAGSEDNRRTANSGERLIESGAINRSLFVLGQVVDALNCGSIRIPYRDSKLTRLLQDSLGGQAYALIIANISPCEASALDTNSTLNFASKSRLVENNVILAVANTDDAKSIKMTNKILGGINNSGEMDSASDRGKRRRTKMSSPTTFSATESDPPKHPPKKLFPSEGKESNPFQSSTAGHSTIQQMILEKRIEEKVAEKLKQLSRGTILSPLLKGNVDLLKKGSFGSPLTKLLAKQQKKPKATSRKVPKKGQPNEETLDPQVQQLLPLVEPELLRIINYGTVKEIKALNEIGAKRATNIVEFRDEKGQPLESLYDLLTNGIITGKVLSKIILANAIGHVNFVPTAMVVDNAVTMVVNPDERQKNIEKDFHFDTADFSRLPRSDSEPYGDGNDDDDDDNNNNNGNDGGKDDNGNDDDGNDDDDNHSSNNMLIRTRFLARYNPIIYSEDN